MKSLFKLVKSLHPSEKRYVNLRLQSSKTNSLLHAYFETIQTLKEYDFDKIAEKHSSAAPKILKNSLRNLYANVLRYLRAYNALSDSEGQLADMLKDVRNLQEKSMYEEAEKLNSKLLKQSQILEYFFYEKEALQNSWNLNHLRGQLKFNVTEEIERQLEEAESKELEVSIINKSYRKAVTLYYQYFFYERKPSFKNELVEIANSPLIRDISNLNSAKAKISSFEIQAMGAIIQGDLLAHHDVRKDQYKLLLTSEVFQKSYLSQILVLSNVLTYLKASSAIKVFEKYLGYMKSYFLPLVEKNTDGVLTEKYYDIYFQNHIYLQYWYLDKDEINNLIEEFKWASKKEFKRNKLLVSRVYLSFAQLLILSGDYKHALQHLIEYQSLSLDKKNSTFFVDSELHLLMVHYLMDKPDVFDKSVETIRRKERVETIIFNDEQKVLFDAFFSIYKNGKVEEVNYQGNKAWLKVYLEVLQKTPMEDAVKSQFNLSKAVESQKDEKYLEWLNSLK